MSGSLNRVMLIGNVGREPEIRQTNAGKSIANFTLATSDVWRDKQSGERQERTQWHRVSCFNDHITKVIESYVKKGTKIYISGSLQTRQYTDKDGAERFITEVILQAFNGELVLLDSKGSDERETAAMPYEVGSERDPQAPPRQGAQPMKDALDDDIPFSPQVLG